MWEERMEVRGLRMGAPTLAFGGGHFQVCGAVCLSVHSPAVRPPPATSLVTLAGQSGFQATSPFRRDISLHSGGQREVEGVSIPPSPRGEGGKRPHSQRDPVRTLVGLVGRWV